MDPRHSSSNNPERPHQGEHGKPIHGVWTALATPFRADLQVDWEAFERLLAEQNAGRVHGVVISGTTGESPTLTVQEKLALLRKARSVLHPEVRLMAGTGDSNTQQSVELSRLAQDAGADSLLVVTPPYNKPNTAGLILHYRSIVQAVRIPVCLYHVPGRTAHMLTVEQLTTVCEKTGVRSVKEASADIAFFSRVLQRCGAGLTFLSGDDTTYLASLAVGGQGVISVVSNIFPKAMVDLYDAFRAGNMIRALALHNALLPAIDVLFCETNPCPLKAALAARGLAQNTLRPPLAPVSEANVQRVRDQIASVQTALQRTLQA